MIYRGSRYGQITRPSLLPVTWEEREELTAMPIEEQQRYLLEKMEALRAQAAAGRAAEEARKAAAPAPSVIPVVAAAGGLGLLWLLL